MPQEPQPTSILDARLAEIDRRLGQIQTGLVEDEPELAAPPPEPSAPPPRPPAPPAAPSVAAELIAKLRALVSAHARLLDSMRELVAAYEIAIARTDASAPPASAPEPGTEPAIVRALSLSAGPLKSTEALRGFERTLSGIPEVREVHVRGYEGGDRAIVDVQLIDPTS